MQSPADLESLYKSWLKEYGGIVVKVTRSFAQTLTDVADLRQEVLLQLWLSLRTFAGQAKPSTWIYQVSLNTALTWRRKAARREASIEREADLGQIRAPGISPADNAVNRDALDQLYAAIHTLPDFDRALILLSLDGLAYREIAQVTGLTENHVGVALTRARQSLAEKLKGLNHELE